MMFIFLVLIVLVVYFVSKNGGYNFKINNRALEILDERYAKGEITEEEYVRRKKLLQEK